MTTDFSAASSALGYIHQIRYALFLLLTSKEEAKLSLETLDDVVLENNGDITQLIQVKYHSNPEAIMGDYSVDFWKTIRIWSENLLDNKINLENTVLSLITTSRVKDEEVITSLKKQNTARNNKKLIDGLIEVTKKSTNKALAPAFTKFNELSYQQKELLIDSIVIIDNSFNILEIAERIKRSYLELSVPEEKFLQPLYERIEGWWFNWSIYHLSNNSNVPIPRIELIKKIRQKAQEFKPDALTIDYLFAEPPDAPDPEGDTRLFVRQLKEIALENEAIENAIRDYYKAFVQRSRWVRDGQLNDGELEQYEKRLINEWERVLLRHKRNIQDLNNDQELKRCGLSVYEWMEYDAIDRVAPIRPAVNEAYVLRGTYHILADREPEPSIYWHPNFVQRLQALLAPSQ